MGIFSFLRRKKKEDYYIDEPNTPISTTTSTMPSTGTTGTTVAVQMPPMSSRAEVDLIISRMENLRMQYEAINARLTNIERLVAEIRSFCK
jgi:hypothetical protein